MKRIHKILVMIITMVAIIIGWHTVASAYLSESANVTNLSIDSLLEHDNLYCVWYGQVMDYNVTYYRRTIITIRGNSVYFEQYGRKYKWTDYRTSKRR